MKRRRIGIAVILILGVIAAATTATYVWNQPRHYLVEHFTLPPNCSAYVCRISLDLNISRPTHLTIRYSSDNPVYAELDHYSNYTGNFVEVMHSPGSGEIDAYATCNLGVYEVWFSASNNPSETHVTVTVDESDVPETTFQCG